MSSATKKTGAFPGQRADADSEGRSLGFRSSNPNHTVEMKEKLDYRIFEIDPRIQRAEEPAEIKRIVANFNPDALGTFTISVREVELPGGEKVTKWFLVDGQQRRASLLQLKWPGRVRAVVHYNLTEAEEAQLFLDLNTRFTIGPWGRFKARLVAGEAQAVAIKKMLDDLNIPVGGQHGFNAIHVADRIYAKSPKGAANLRWALQLLKDVYNKFDHRALEALALIHEEYDIYIDTESMRTKLQANLPQLAQLIGNGTTVQQLYHCSMPLAVAEAIISTYNKHTRLGAKRSSRLPSIMDRKRKPSWQNREALAAMNADDDQEAKQAEVDLKVHGIDEDEDQAEDDYFVD